MGFGAWVLGFGVWGLVSLDNQAESRKLPGDSKPTRNLPHSRANRGDRFCGLWGYTPLNDDRSDFSRSRPVILHGVVSPDGQGEGPGVAPLQGFGLVWGL